jgi:hypothetical protein
MRWKPSINKESLHEKMSASFAKTREAIENVEKVK